jgi:NTP pyrophosphatase (non-canonical NTP hydrolase)
MGQVNLDDSATRVTELKRMVREFSKERDWDQFHQAKDLAIGIVTEASELLQLLRFKDSKEIDAIFRNQAASKKVRDELSDVIYFILQFASHYNIDVSKSLQEKLRDNAMKYPIEKAKGSNKKYTEYGK